MAKIPLKIKKFYLKFVIFHIMGEFITIKIPFQFKLDFLVHHHLNQAWLMNYSLPYMLENRLDNRIDASSWKTNWVILKSWLIH